MVKQIQVERRTKSGWWSLWMVLLVCLSLWQAYLVWSLMERRDELVAKTKTAAGQAGLALGYNVALQRILMEWGLGSGVLGVLLLASRGRKRIEMIWIDDAGNEVRGPDPSPRT